MNLRSCTQAERAPFERVRLELSGCISVGNVLLPPCNLYRTHGTLKMRKTFVVDDDPLFVKEEML